MLSFNPTLPKRICLITTFRCMAECDSCCFGCVHDKGRTMTLDQMKRYVDLCLEAYPESIVSLSLTGGECFMLGDNLEKIIRYAKDKGLPTGLVTNGYWGKKYAEAFSLLSKLKEAGLNAIDFSAGNAHQNLIPLRNCRNAIVAAARLGLKPNVRLESRYGTTAVYDKLMSDNAFKRLVNEEKITLQTWQWRTYNNIVKHRRLRYFHFRPFDGKPCDLLFKDIILTPYGDMLACCGIGSARIPQMRLGNIEKEPVRTVYERGFQDALKVWLRLEGPEALLQYVYDNSDIHLHECSACKGCEEIFGNPEIIPFLKDHYDEWMDKILYKSTIL